MRCMHAKFARLRDCGDEPKHPAQPVESVHMTNAIEQLIVEAERAQVAPAESISSLLHKACKEPAIPTIEYLSASLAARVNPLLRDAVAEAVQAEQRLWTTRDTGVAMWSVEANQ